MEYFWIGCVIMVWLLAGYGGYAIIRWHLRKITNQWTVGNRRQWLGFSLYMGPLMLFSAGMTALTWKRNQDKTPSEW